MSQSSTFAQAEYDAVEMAIAAASGTLSARDDARLRREVGDYPAKHRTHRNGIDTSIIFAQRKWDAVHEAYARAQAGELVPAMHERGDDRWDIVRLEALTTPRGTSGRYGPWMAGGILFIREDAGQYDATTTDGWRGGEEAIPANLAHIEALATEGERRLRAELADADAALATDYAAMTLAELVAIASDESRYWMDRRIAAAAIVAATRPVAA